MSGFRDAERVADAILYEGYALYPYRPSSAKNRVRFQWGVLVPAAYTAIDGSERSISQCECIAERATGSTLRIRVRFLHLTQRLLYRVEEGRRSQVDTLDMGDHDLQTWDDADEIDLDFEVDIDAAAVSPLVREFILDATVGEEQAFPADGAPGLVVRTTQQLDLRTTVSFLPIESPYGIGRITVKVENTTEVVGLLEGRDDALRSSLVGCHLLLGLESGEFVSQMAPPEWARPYTGQCENIGTYPILIGEDKDRHTILASPIILYDHPEIAPESPGNLFDSTEIDEILTLRTMTLTDDEKRQARGTDSRVAAIIDQADFLPPEMLDKLHGAIRSVEPVRPGEEIESVPWWDPGSDTSVSPDTDSVVIEGISVARGSRVLLAPRLQRADAQDMFLKDRVGVVEAVVFDVDDGTHLAISLEDDPGADMVQVHGRFLYFSPDEVRPMELVQ